MAEGLAEAWSRLTLMTEEKVVEVFEEDIPQEKAEEIELNFLGKLLTKNNFNSKAVKTVFNTIRKPSKGLVI